jgi:hypothetical protein
MMKEELTRSERGLIWTAFVFAVMAVSMVVLPYLATWAIARHSGNPELGGAAFGMTFGLMMMGIGAFSWLGSLAMLVVNLSTNRRALKTPIGVAAVVLDAGVLAYAIFSISIIVRESMR